LGSEEQGILKNREGVCDEITTLFIALLRSLKIPARFVSGISYTNSDLFAEPWGLHGWAEVYFPDYGWVPFDVTYGQFGYIDAAHIKLLDSNDAGKSSSKFEWKAIETDLTAGQLVTKTSIVKKGQPLDELFDMDISFFSSNVGFGSYDLATVTLTNRQDYYVTTELSISKPREVTVIGDQRKMILLMPKAQKKLVWILKVDEDLKKGYAYTFPVVLQTQRNLMSRADFKATDGKIVYALKDMQKVQNELVDEEKKVYSKNIAFACSAPSDKTLANATFIINCTAQNTGNINLGAITYCLDGGNCTTSGLGIAQSQEIFFNETFSSLGEKSVRLSAESPEVSAASYLKIWAMDKPRLTIYDIKHPVEVAYDDEFSIEFKVMRESMSEPQDVKVYFTYGFESQEWKIDSLDQYQPFKVSVSGSMLNLDRNRFVVNTTYRDDDGARYSTLNEFYVTLKEPTLWQKVKIFFNSLGRQILGLFPART
jgi:hypothetical protein